jgi:hypothetical protein
MIMGASPHGKAISDRRSGIGIIFHGRWDCVKVAQPVSIHLYGLVEEESRPHGD